MKYTGLCVLAFLAWSQNSFAQTIERQEISSAGDFSTAGNISLSWTLGQPALVETFTASNIVLTQGFQQVEINTMGTDDAGSGNLSVTVYPNPSAYQFHLQFSSALNGELEYTVVDNTGRIISQSSLLPVMQGTQSFEIKTTGWAQGLYYLAVRFHTDGKDSFYTSKLDFLK